ncbi:MAG: hypothetical protein AAGG46_07145 [Planctomycetota bacterium]
MAKNQNTLGKRMREMEKKRKADEKRARREQRKDQPSGPIYGEVSPTGEVIPLDSEDQAAE